MKISIISTSHRKNSQSKRISNIFKNVIFKINNSTECFNLDMFDSNIPLWTSEKKENSNPNLLMKQNYLWLLYPQRKQ